MINPYTDQLFSHIKQNAQEKNIYIDRINGYIDHLHCLVSLGVDQSIEKVTNLLKGESSFWFNNRSGFKTRKLEWQNQYFAISVSESILDKVRMYIDGQVEHHRIKTFAEEYQQFIHQYGFQEMG